MGPNEIAGIAGAFAAGVVGTGAVFVKHVWPLVRKGEADREALKTEVGVGVGPETMSSLVMSTASAVRRIEEDGARNWSGITEVLRVQKTHGEKLDSHEKRFIVIEDDHKKLHSRLDGFACSGGATPPCHPPVEQTPPARRRRA